jgi:high affinity Mn2+ porin
MRSTTKINIQRYCSFSVLLLFTIKQHAQSDSSRVKRFSLHAQATCINQYKPTFHTPYTGANSLLPQQEDQTSFTSTFYAALKCWKGGTLVLNPELAAGSGLSKALGIADATNGETFRIGSPKPKLYLARFFYRQIISLSKTNVFKSTDLNTVADSIPTKYLSFTLGKIGIADYFDNNSYSHDPRTQFLSWGLMSNGAWDYPANTRGYTPSAVIEFISPVHELRAAMSMVPLTANGNLMNRALNKAAAYTIEYCFKPTFLKRPSTFRALVFYNTCNMGNYQQSIAQANPVPDIISTRNYGRSKYGIGISLDQELSNNLGVFARSSWNDGTNETWAFTEIDRSLSLGAVIKGNTWQRKNDLIGLAGVVSGTSSAHRQYLASGGYGFMLGDGQLKYSSEKLLELYYNCALKADNLWLSFTYQAIVNPGYNLDRKGPVNVFSLRLHIKI